uniref:Peptidase S59 domain-containing protein n=1 Tax=Brassica campestris TaxID=3711 RepID=A0A3P6AZF0_BRACM|nr:unnamed protein product [Brassica rapa]
MGLIIGLWPNIYLVFYGATVRERWTLSLSLSLSLSIPWWSITASLSKLQISTMATSLDSHRKILFDGNDIRDSLPSLNSPDYFLKPSMNELVQREIESPGYCSRVPDFTIGRIGYGFIKFLGSTDVRNLDLDQIVKF